MHRALLGSFGTDTCEALYYAEFAWLRPPSTPVDSGVENISTGVPELVTEAQQLWNDCSGALRSQVSEAAWKAWFSGIRPLAVANGTLVLAVPNAVVRERLEGRFAAPCRTRSTTRRVRTTRSDSTSSRRSARWR